MVSIDQSALVLLKRTLWTHLHPSVAHTYVLRLPGTLLKRPLLVRASVRASCAEENFLSPSTSLSACFPPSDSKCEGFDLTGFDSASELESESGLDCVSELESECECVVESGCDSLVCASFSFGSSSRLLFIRIEVFMHNRQICPSDTPKNHVTAAFGPGPKRPMSITCSVDLQDWHEGMVKEEPGACMG